MIKTSNLLPNEIEFLNAEISMLVEVESVESIQGILNKGFTEHGFFKHTYISTNHGEFHKTFYVIKMFH